MPIILLLSRQPAMVLSTGPKSAFPTPWCECIAGKQDKSAEKCCRLTYHIGWYSSFALDRTFLAPLKPDFLANLFPSLRDKLRLILKATRTHARNLATFAVAYKASMIFLRRASLDNKERPFHSFLAGLTGGYLVFGRGIQSSVNQQIVIYVFARVVLALAKLSVQKRGEGGVGIGRDLREKVERNAWPVFASLSWAMVMWIFRWYPETIQPSLKSSMKYM